MLVTVVPSSMVSDTEPVLPSGTLASQVMMAMPSASMSETPSGSTMRKLASFSAMRGISTVPAA